MRLLLDTCVWGNVADELRVAGHDVDWVGNWPADPGDEEILAHANPEGRILVTLDKNFGALIIVHRRPHRGILRVVGISARKQAAVIQHVLALHGDELEAGAVITAEPGRLRIRPPEAKDPEPYANLADRSTDGSPPLAASIRELRPPTRPLHMEDRRATAGGTTRVSTIPG